MELKVKKVNDNMNKRIYVKTLLFEGWATITDYFPNEAHYPIQVILDEGDADGHKVKRVCKDDIISGMKETMK